MKRLLFIFVLSCCCCLTYATRYCYAHLCYVDKVTNAFTEWKYNVCKAEVSDNKDVVRFYYYDRDSNKNFIAFQINMNKSEIYSLSSKEIKKKVKSEYEFEGSGTVSYYTNYPLKGTFEFKFFPTGNSSYNPKPTGDWKTYNARISFFRKNGTDYDYYAVWVNGYHIEFCLSDKQLIYY